MKRKTRKKKCIFWELLMTVVPEDTCKLLSWIGLQLLLTVWGGKEKGCDSFFWFFYHPLLWLGLWRWLSCCDVFSVEFWDQENPRLPEAGTRGVTEEKCVLTSACEGYMLWHLRRHLWCCCCIWELKVPHVLDRQWTESIKFIIYLIS